MELMPSVSEESILQQSSIIFGVITFGLAQSFYGLVLAKPQAFPQNIFFAGWILIFLQIIPFLILFGADILLKRHTPSGIFRVWRALLGTLLFLSLLRQFQVFYPSIFVRYLSFVRPSFIYVLSSAILFFIFWKWSRGCTLYLRYLGICSIALPIFFLIQTHAIRIVNFIQADSSSRANLTPVFILVFDELSLEVLLRQDHFDRALFPNFAAFAADSIWFRNATTNHWSTVDSIPSLITGHVQAGMNSTLFELLPDYTGVVLTAEMEIENWVLSQPEHRGIQRLQGKTYYLSHNPARTLQYLWGRLFGYFRFTAAENIILDDPAYHVSLNDQIKHCFELIHSGQSMLLLWHPSIPHSPFVFDKDGKEHGQAPNYFPFEREYKRSQFDLINQLYRKQVEFADSILEDFLSALKRASLYERSVIVVTSDHGLRVWGDLLSHGERLTRVPVMIKIPGKSSRIVDTDFQLIDIVPTLMDALGRSNDKHTFQGISGGSQLPRKKITHFLPGSLLYDSNKQIWIDSRKKIIPSTTASQRKRLARENFSSIFVWDDLFTAEEEQRDFLELYLRKDFPIHLKPSDFEQFRSKIAKEPEPQTPQKHFRLGMWYFYVALWDSYQIANDGPGDIETINRNWQKTLHHLQMAGHLSPLLQQHVDRFLTEADTNEDGKWSQAEIIAMIRSRMNR